LTSVTASARSALTRGRARWPIFLGLAAVVFVFDQLTKAWLVWRLPTPGERLDVVGDYVRLVHSQNSGALFGLFRDQAIIFALISVGVVAGIIWFHHSSGRNTLLSVALGLLLGGALGNMADRFRIGYVVDFVDLGIGTLRWYTFNVADSAISGAILLLIASAIIGERFGDRREAPKTPPDTVDRPDA
jgi:signal peptidase II